LVDLADRLELLLVIVGVLVVNEVPGDREVLGSISRVFLHHDLKADSCGLLMEFVEPPFDTETDFLLFLVAKVLWKERVV